MLHRFPIDPNWAPLLINWKRNNIEDKIFIELLLELGCVICTVQRHLQAGFGSICESWGLSNLTPSRSKLFKLMGKGKGMRWSCSKRLAYMVAKHMQMRARREGKARSWNYHQEVILEQPTSSITPTPCSLPGLRRKETITVTHAVDVF